MADLSAAHEVALKKFRACSLENMASCSGYPIDGFALAVNFLEAHYKVYYPSGSFEGVSVSDGELPLSTQILILHYLANPSETLDTGKLISFKELPAGAIYIKPFTGRSIDPLIKIFGANPDSLLEVATSIGGQPNGLGDVGVTIRVFPRIPLTLVLWRADDEFPASGNILFDASAPLILPTEDYAVLASSVVFGLKRLKTIS
ncbi:MAG TPA: DUF3786 domain-containing protein [Desulfosporosinus sp.]|nr:DUF3786 domain-containing protein [Desulfosporosinus sp.]